MQPLAFRNVSHVLRYVLVCSLSMAALMTAGLTSARASETDSLAVTTASEPGLKPFAGVVTASPMRVASVDGRLMARPFLMQSAAASAVVASSAGRGRGQVGLISPFPVSLRLGALLSPRTKFDAGIDASIPGLHLLPNFNTRVDLDVIFSANLGGVTTLVPVTFDQIYSKGLVGGTRVFAGAGIGPYFGDKTRFGGKLLFGADVTSRIGAEVDVHFAGVGDPLVSLVARIGL